MVTSAENNKTNGTTKCIILRHSHAFENKQKRDLMITQTIILTLFEPSLLKISLKFFNFLMISIINQIFQEILFLSTYNFSIVEQKHSKRTHDVSNDERSGKLRRAHNIEVTEAEKNVENFKNSYRKIPPELPIFNLIKKFRVDIEIYFCMICMNSILFSKELFYKNSIDYFFKDVLPNSLQCYNYFKGVVIKYVKERNDHACKWGIYHIYCSKILLIYYYLSTNNILEKMYLNLLPEILNCKKKKNPFFESLIYLIYLNYYGINRNVSVRRRSISFEHNRLCYMLEENGRNKKNYQKCAYKVKNENKNNSAIRSDEKKCSTFYKCSINRKMKQRSTYNIYDTLLRYNYNVQDLNYLYIEKFHNNIEENNIIKFYVHAESVLYPIFRLKSRKNINSLKTGSNFIITERLKRLIKELIINVYNKKPTILIGNQGSGKTSLIKYIFEKLYQNEDQKEENIISLYLDDVSDSKSILGLWESNEKCFEFKYGILAKAMKSGNWVVFENINNISNSVIEKLHELTSKGHIYLSEKGEYIYPHKNFRLFSTITVNSDNYNNSESISNEENTVDEGNTEMDEVNGTREGSHISSGSSSGSSCDEKWARSNHLNYSNRDIGEVIRMNYRPNNLTNLFNKWHSVYIGNYSRREIKEILFKKLKSSVHDNYKNVLLKCYSIMKTSLQKYHILRNINLHDLIKIVKRINKKKIFMYESEKMKIFLFQICKSILISHIPNIHLRSIFFTKLVNIFELNEKDVMTNIKSYSLDRYIDEFNESLENNYPKVVFNYEKISNYSFILTSVHKSILYEIIEGVYNKESILLIGDTGVGKTALVDYISKIFETKLHVFVFSEQSEASDLIGNYYPFNISVKTNELFEEFKKLNHKISCYIHEKELDVFYIKLSIILSEKKFLTFLNTCYNYVKCVITNFKNNTKLFDMKIIKKCKTFQRNCKNIINFWCTNNCNLNKGRMNKIKNHYALNYNFEKFFKKCENHVEGEKICYKDNDEACNLDDKAEREKGKNNKDPVTCIVEEEECSQNANELIFKFHDGILIDCIKNGHWILLDEINLAQTEILQRLQGLMDLSNKHFEVVEKGNEQIKIHKNFRLFACMNPPIIPSMKKKKTEKNMAESGNANRDRGISGRGIHDKGSNSYNNDSSIDADMIDNVNIDLYNSTISSGKRELPPIIRNKFTEIFVDEILEYEDIEMIVKHLLKEITCDTVLIKNITNCYLEIKKESLKNMNSQDNKPISFSTRNLVRAINYAVHVHKRKFKPLSLYVAVYHGFICNFLSCVNLYNQKIIENIFNKYFKYPKQNKAQNCNNDVMHIEKNGIINYTILENYYLYKWYNKKKGIEESSASTHSASTTICSNSRSSNSSNNKGNNNNNSNKNKGNNNSNSTKYKSNCNSNNSSNVVIRNTNEMEKYACIENSWILCGNEEVDLKSILSNFIITKNVKENIKKLALCLSGIKTPILLEGNTSVGKTSLVKFFADITGHKFIRINNHMNTDINEYYGQFVNDKNNGNLIFEEGIFVKAVRNGYWVVLDELNLAPSEVLESLNRILDDNKEIYIPELKCYVKAHKDFMLFATQNPANSNKYIGRKELSKAFRSRFIEFYINDFEVEELEIILHRRCAISPNISKKMIQVFTELRNVKSNYNYFNDNLMTLRDLIKWGNRYPNTNTEACLHGYYIIAEKLRNEKDKQTVKDILSKNFLKKEEELIVNYENDQDVKNLKDIFFKKISSINNLQNVQSKSLSEDNRMARGTHSSLGLRSGDQGKNDDQEEENDESSICEKPYKYDEYLKCDNLKRFEYLKNIHFGKNMSRIICLLLKCFKNKESALLIGETGCGKTTCCELLSFVKNIKLNVLNCNESTDVYDIIGSLKLVQNKKEDYEKLKKNCIELYNEITQNYQDQFASMFLSGIIHEKITDIKKEDFLIFNLYLQKRYNLNENIKRKLIKMERSINNLKSVFTWFDGILVSSLKKGDIFLMDEISLVESSVLERFNSVLEYDRTLLLTEKGGKNIKNLKAHDNFSFIGTMNPCGDFGKKEISQTLKNRFTEIFVETCSYKSEDFYFLIMKQLNFTEKKKKIYIKQHIARCLCSLFQQITENRALSLSSLSSSSSSLRFTLSNRDAIKWTTFMNIYINNKKQLYIKKKKDKTIEISTNKLKAYCIRSYYHSGCLILIDGNEDMKSKQILQNILMKNLEDLCTSFKYKLHGKKKKKKCMNFFRETYNFIFKKKYLRINDLRVIFKKRLRYDLNELSQSSNFVFKTPNIKKNLFKIIRAMQLNNSILLEGSPGVGKTCIINILAKLTNNKLIRINLSECTDIYDFIGSYFPIKEKSSKQLRCGVQGEEVEEEQYDKAQTEQREKAKTAVEKKAKFAYFWKDGKLIECMKKGYWILIDEINLANQQTLEGINSILDHRKEIFIPETNEIVKCHENFRLFCCQNPYKEGGGRKGLPKSFLNRFSKIYFEELNEEDYLCIVQSLYGNFISSDIIKKIVKIIFVIKKINVLLNESECWVWNLRDILRICKFMKYYSASSNFVMICEMLICSRLTCTEDRTIVRSVIANIYSGNDDFVNQLSEVTTRDNLINSLNCSNRNSNGNGNTNNGSNDRSYNSCNAATYASDNYNFLCSAFSEISDHVMSCFSPDKRNSLITKGSHKNTNASLCSNFTLSLHILAKDEKILHECLYAIELNIPILLNGQNNCGKSSFVYKLSSIFQKKLFEFSLTNDVDTFDLFGCYEHNSRNNAIKNFEKKIYKLNKLFLKIVFKKENLGKFYTSLFSKKENAKNGENGENSGTSIVDTHESDEQNKNKKKRKQIKINIMEKINHLSFRYINALKNKKYNLKIAENEYVGFINNIKKICKKECNKMAHILSNITYLCKIINENHINENVYIYNEGNFIKAIKYGHWVLLKHLHHSVPSLLDRLNSLFEENGYILLHEFGKKKKIKPHKNFQIFLTLNSEEHYKISKALRNRCYEIYFGHMNEYVNNAINFYHHPLGTSIVNSISKFESKCNSNNKPCKVHMSVCEEERFRYENTFINSSKDSYLMSSINDSVQYSKNNNVLINTYDDPKRSKNFHIHMINLCYSFQYKSSSDDLAKEIHIAGQNKTQIEKDYVNLIKKNNIFFYLIKSILKNVRKGKKYASICDRSRCSSSYLTVPLVDLFIKKDGIKMNCTKILDYVNYCYNSFYVTHGVRLNVDLVYFCLIISLVTYIIEYIFDEDTINETKKILKNSKLNHTFKKSLQILLNYKFENNFYYIDKYIEFICSNFLLARNRNSIRSTRSRSRRSFKNLGQWKPIFMNSFVNFYCLIFSKLNGEIQLLCYPFFDHLNNCVINVVYRLKIKIRKFIKNREQLNSLISNINSSNFVHKIQYKYFIYFYFHIFINYIYNFNKLYDKGTVLFNESCGNNNTYAYILKEITLVSSFYKLKLNKVFCYLVYCFIQNFSLYDIFYRYEYLLNLKNKIIIKWDSLSRDYYDIETAMYLDFVTRKIICKKFVYFNIIINYIYNAIYNEKSAKCDQINKNCVNVKRSSNDTFWEQKSRHDIKKENNSSSNNNNNNNYNNDNNNNDNNNNNN
ncbi:dynein-related AAA-type ATPase, putative, partial [Plasmodium malariae]